MKMDRNTLGKKFLAIGLVFLVAGFVTQGFTLSFESGLFNLGVIFTLSALATLGLDRMRASSSDN